MNSLSFDIGIFTLLRLPVPCADFAVRLAAGSPTRLPRPYTRSKSRPREDALLVVGPATSEAARGALQTKRRSTSSGHELGQPLAGLGDAPAAYPRLRAFVRAQRSRLPRPNQALPHGFAFVTFTTNTAAKIQRFEIPTVVGLTHDGVLPCLSHYDWGLCVPGHGELRGSVDYLVTIHRSTKAS